MCSRIKTYTQPLHTPASNRSTIVVVLRDYEIVLHQNGLHRILNQECVAYIKDGDFMLIGKIMTNSKQRLLVTVEDHKGIKVIDLRAYQIINDGELMPTAEGISFAPEKVDTVINLLREAQKKLSGIEA
jgi:hypothetical protein